jgi:CheY-like chemotaxis protein
MFSETYIGSMSKPIRVLIVEDSLIDQAITSKHLKELGCVVDAAQNGSMALIQCDNSPYDVVLMDLGLYPNDSGFDVAKQIREHSLLNRATPIVALSSHSEAQSYQQIKESGIKGFIAKPFLKIEALQLLYFLATRG